MATTTAAAPEATTPASALSAAERWNRKIDTAIVVLLAAASLLAAWGGYQAGLWSSKKTTAVTTAEIRQIDATRATTIGYQVMQVDVAIFMQWLNAYKEENTALASFYEARFSPQLQPAFATWMAADALANPDAPLHPFATAEYRVPQLGEAAALDEAAHMAFAEADRYGEIGDAYVLSTLLLAVVLFFGGVCTKIGWRPAQLALFGVALVLLAYGVWQLGALPDGSAWQLTPRWG